MTWYQIFYDICNNLITRNKTEGTMDSKFLDTNKAFLRGMASISSFHSGRSLDEYRTEINQLTGWTNNPDERIGRCWHNVGAHLNNAMNSFAKKNNLPKPSLFDSKIEYY